MSTADLVRPDLLGPALAEATGDGRWRSLERQIRRWNDQWEKTKITRKERSMNSGLSRSRRIKEWTLGCRSQTEEVCTRMRAFMREEVFLAEKEYGQWRANNDPHAHPPVLERLKASAKKRDLWNLFLPEISGLSNLEYAAVAEISGWSPVIAPEAINCQAPDTGNMETLTVRDAGAGEAMARTVAVGGDPFGVRDDRTERGVL